MRMGAKAKIRKFKFFLITLLKTSYEYRESPIVDFFRPNAHVHLIRGGVFFKTPKKNTLKKYANKSL